MKMLLDKIDKFCLKWLGIRYAIRPNQVKLIENDLIIISTESNRRFPRAEKLKEFVAEIPYVEQGDKERLGVAIGKAIASDLVVSFEPVQKNTSNEI